MVDHEEVYVIGTILCAEGGNPMQACFVSHIGTKGNKPCRVCEVEKCDGTAGSREKLIKVR